MVFDVGRYKRGVRNVKTLIFNSFYVLDMDDWCINVDFGDRKMK